MEINEALLDIKNEILRVKQEMKLVGSSKRYNQLKKHKHRLEKEVMKYMYYRYGILMRKEKK
jgi:hypothetical protein